MIRYLLDTNVIIQIFAKNAIVDARLTQVPAEACAISSIVLHELYFGAYKSQATERNLTRLARMTTSVLPFGAEEAQSAGEIRAMLSGLGLSIGPLDILIAGHARSRGLILVTHNVREFSRVKDLVIEDWEIP